MTLAKVVSTSALSLLLATTALLYAQEQREDPKPEEARPEATKQDETPRHEEAKPMKQDESKPAEEKAGKQDEKQTKEEKQQQDKAAQDKTAKEQNQNSANHADQSQKGMQRAGDQHGGRIPDDKFRSNFGRQHTFAVHRATVGGQSGFQYGGYSFTFGDAWPVGWAYTDDCYVDYIDGEYFLFDVLHPGVRLAVVVVL
jgi:flagellar motor protein MotB